MSYVQKVWWIVIVSLIAAYALIWSVITAGDAMSTCKQNSNQSADTCEYYTH